DRPHGDTTTTPDPNMTDPSNPSPDTLGRWRAIAPFAESRDDTRAFWDGQRVVLFGGTHTPAALEPDASTLEDLPHATALLGTDPMAVMPDARDIVAWRVGAGGRYDLAA